jgi:flagellar biosynthesis anti-sigma factor FlgM
LEFLVKVFKVLPIRLFDGKKKVQIKEIVMSDSISQIGKPTTPASVRPEQVTKSDEEASVAVPKQPGLNVDQFTLSPAAESALATASFDETKVAQLKAAISEGLYPVNPESVAEKFIALEDMIGGE